VQPLQPNAMPSAKNAKRTSEFQAKSSATKKAKVTMTPVEKKFNAVMGALTNEETVVPGPESCRAMLAAAASTALKVPKDSRHADQEAVFGMLMEIFDAEVRRWEDRVADATNNLEKATAERTEKMNLKDAAESELKIQKDVVRGKMEAQSKAIEVVEESKEELSRAQSLHADAEAAKDHLAKTQGHDLAIQEIIKGLKEGIYENPKELKKHITAVSELLVSLGIEEALVKTLPQILRRKPLERGSFDDMALQQLDSYLNDHLSSLGSKIEAADVIVMEHAAAITAWEAVVEVAEEKKYDSDEALKTTEAQQEQVQGTLTCARKVLKESTTIVKSRGSELASEEWGLDSIKEVREALEFLREFVTPPPEEAKEPEQVAAEFAGEMPMDNIEKVEDTFEETIIPDTKTKDIVMDMNPQDVPSPAKKARQSLAANIPMVVA